MKYSEYFKKYPTCTWKNDRVNVTLSCSVPISIPGLCEAHGRAYIAVWVVIDGKRNGETYKFPLKDYEAAKKFATKLYESRSKSLKED